MTVKPWAWVFAMSAVALGCGGGGTEPEDAQGSGTAVDLEQVAINKLRTSCAESAAGPECRQAMNLVLRSDKPDSLDAVAEWCAPVCLQAVDASCVAAALALVESGRLAPLAEVLAEGTGSGKDLVDALSPDIRANLEQAWCSTYPPADACALFLEARISLDDQAALERKLQLHLRTVVAESYKTNRNKPAALLQQVPGGEGIRQLLRLAARDPSMTRAERSYIVAAVQSIGAHAYPELVDLIKSEGLPVGLEAAEVGWDSRAYEEDVYRPPEEPQRTVALDESVDYVGKRLTIFHRDGTKREGVLKRIEGDVLVVEVTIGGGAMTMKINRDDVERIAF